MAKALDKTVIGLISDTHGLLRPTVHNALAGSDLILHAGDVGGEEILDELRLIAPVRAVFGNTDPSDHPFLEYEIDMTVSGLSIHVSHGHEVGSPTPAKLAAAYPHQVIIYGHTHRQLVSIIDGRLVINPGAAGHRRFKLVPSVGRLTITGGQPEVQIVALD